MIINGAVLFAILESDLGPHRKIGTFRILRAPLVIAAVIPLFIDRPVTHGKGLLVELAGLAAGLFCGLIISTLMRVYRSPKTGRPVSATGLPLRDRVDPCGGRPGGVLHRATHWFPVQLSQWCVAHQVTGAAITDGLIFMALTMVVVRTASLGARSSRLRNTPAGRTGNRLTATA